MAIRPPPILEPFFVGAGPRACPDSKSAVGAPHAAPVQSTPNFSIPEVYGSVVMARYTARRRCGDCSRVGSPESTSSLPVDMDAATALRRLLSVDQDQATARSPS